MLQCGGLKNYESIDEPAERSRDRMPARQLSNSRTNGALESVKVTTLLNLHYSQRRPEEVKVPEKMQKAAELVY